MGSITPLRILVLTLLALLSALAFYFGTFPLAKLTPYWGRAGYFDWPIFLDAARRFLDTGTLYTSDLSQYGPSAEVYKFPPLFAVLLATCLQAGISDEALRLGMASLHLLAYFTSVLVCLRVAGAKWNFFLCTTTFLFLATFEPFIENYIGLQLEIWLLLLLCLCYYSVAARHFFIAGTLVGLAAALKLYPAIFILVAYFCERPLRFVAGALTAMTLTGVFTLAVIGFDQHALYFSRIAPLLATESLYTTRQNVSINNFLYHMGVSEPLWGGWCLLLLTLVVLWYGGKSVAPPVRLQAGLPVLVAVVVLSMKNSWGSYQLLLVLPLMAMLAHVSCGIFGRWCVAVIIGMYAVGALFFYSPPHRLFFFSEWWLGTVEIPVASIGIAMRAIAGLLVLLLSLLFFWKMIQDALKNPVKAD